MKIVRDVTDYELHFFSIPLDREPDKRSVLCQFLNDAVACFAKAVGKEESAYPIQLDLFRQRASDRLAIVRPTRIPSAHELELDVRTLHDAVFIRARALRQGPLRLEDVKAHRPVIPMPRSGKELPNYLGTFRILYAESDEQEGSQRAEIGRQLAIDGGLSWIADAEPIVTELGAMLFGAPPPKPDQRPEAPVLDLIFVGGRDATELAERYPRHPFLITLPELALCHLKVRNSAESLRFTWLRELADRDRELRDLFPKRGESISALAQMRVRNDDITTRQVDLMDALVHVRAQLRTMRTNRDNFVAACSEGFPTVARRLQQALIDSWARGTELQADNDIDYIEGTLNRAESHFKSIEATATVYQARELKRIARWQIILAVVGVAVASVAAYLTWTSAASSGSSLTGQATNPPSIERRKTQ
jgi:hypothetical protein